MSEHSLGLLNNGVLLAWGDNSCGQCNVPQKVFLPPSSGKLTKESSGQLIKQLDRRSQPPSPHQLEQAERMKADIKEYGDFQEFVYKNIRCYMKRPHNTYWCGYLDCGITSDDFEHLEGFAHGGMTARNGFDCAHFGDYPGDLDGEYRDYKYVKSVLEKMVDELTKNE